MDNVQHVKIMFWNSRSVLRKSLEFFDFLKKHNIDIAIITETWLKQTNSFLHPEFHCIRLDRQNTEADRGGGVAIVLKKGINHSQINISTKEIEAVGVDIVSGNSNFHIFAAYFPGGSSRLACSSFKKDIEKLTTRYVPYFIVGDFNARHREWNCAKANKTGTLLHQKAASTGFFIHHPDEPTYYPAGRGRPSTLDLVLSNNLLTMTKPEVISELSSDHFPVIFNIETQPPDPSPPYGYRCYERADWRRFQRYLNDRIDLNSPNISQLESVEAIDRGIENLQNLLEEAESESVPWVPCSPYQVAKIPEETKLLIRLRNARRRRWMRNHDFFLSMIVESLNRRISEECARARYKKFGDTLENLQPGTKQLWKISKALRNNTKYSPPLKDGDRLVSAPADKASLLAESFCFTFTSPDTPEVVADVEEPILSIQEAPSEFPDNWLARPREVKQIVKAMKNKKAPGIDRVMNVCLKHAPKKVLILLTHLFNACLRLSYFPDAWKHAIVIAIPKPNKNITDPSHYRPISLLSALSKILERIILNRIHRTLENNNIIPNQQFGFKQGHSTNHQLLRLSRTIKSAFATRKSAGMIMLDVEKAYDSVWQDAILHKMRLAGFPVVLLKVLQSFLKNRTFQVSVQNCVSEIKQIPYGVPQGSVLSPVLYNIFVSDIAMTDEAEYFLFADDTGYVAIDSTPDGVVDKLQQAQHALERHQKLWKVKVNPSKTQAMFFTWKRSPRNLPQRKVTVCGCEVDWSDEAKYLGLTLDTKLTYGKHITRSLEKCGRTTKMLYSVMNRRSRLPVKYKLLLYKTVFRPVISYGFPTWRGCARSHIQKLQRQQNKLLKMALNLSPFHETEDVHFQAQVEYIDEWINRLMAKFWTSCSASVNPLIEALNI